MKIVRTLLVALLVGIGCVAWPSHAHAAARQPILTVVFGEAGLPPYWEAIAWTRVKRHFEQTHPGVTVRLLALPFGGQRYDDTVTTILASSMLAASDAPPDVVAIDSARIAMEATAGYLTPLDHQLATWPNYARQWYPALRSLTMVNRHTYGVISGSDVRVLWYDKDVFRRAGLPTAWQPHRWADILAAAEAIKAREPGVIPFNLYAGSSAGESASANGLEMLLAGTRDPLYDVATRRWIVTSRGLLDSLAFVARIYDRAHLLGPPIATGGRRRGPKELAANLFAQGKLGIDLDGSWLSSRWSPGGPVPWRQWQRVMGYAKMPIEGGAPPAYVTLSGGWAYVIAARSAHKSASFALIKDFCTRDALAAFDLATGNLAPRRDAGDNAVYNAAPLNAAFTALWQRAAYRPVDPAYPAVSRLLGQAMDDVIAGETPAHAMTRYAAEVSRLVGRDRVERR